MRVLISAKMVKEHRTFPHKQSKGEGGKDTKTQTPEEIERKYVAGQAGT